MQKMIRKFKRRRLLLELRTCTAVRRSAVYRELFALGGVS